MKKIYSLLLLVISCTSFGQTIYSENFGTPTGTTPIATYATGTAPATFQNTTPIAYSGTADVRVDNVQNTFAPDDDQVHCTLSFDGQCVNGQLFVEDELDVQRKLNGCRCY